MPAHFTSALISCATCGKQFLAYQSRLKAGGRYCSRPCYGKSIRQPFGRAFWKYINKTDGCWLWTGPVNDKGYGLTRGPDGKKTTAHRVAWIVVNGPVPDGLWVLHNCPTGDNPLCVRPDHMFLGDHRRNMRDMAAKGRGTLGARNPQAKLTPEQVIEMRRLHREEGMTGTAIAKRFGLGVPHCCSILRGELWPHL